MPFGSTNPACFLDIYSTSFPAAPPTDRSQSKPVCLFVYGSAWSGGSKNAFVAFAKSLTALGYIVVIPDYTKWPKGVLETMVDDITMSFQWTLRNIGAVT